MWLFWNDSKDGGQKTVSSKRAVGFLFLGFCGAVFIAPAINEHFNLKDGMATGVGFLCAVLVDAVLMLLWRVLRSLVAKAEDIGKEIFDKYVGKK